MNSARNDRHKLFLAFDDNSHVPNENDDILERKFHNNFISHHMRDESLTDLVKKLWNSLKTHCSRSFVDSLIFMMCNKDYLFTLKAASLQRYLDIIWNSSQRSEKKFQRSCRFFGDKNQTTSSSNHWKTCKFRHLLFKFQ